MIWKYKSNGSSESVAPTKEYSSPPNIIISSSDLGSDSGSIRVYENNVFFYSDVSEQSALELNHIFIELDNKLQAMKSLFNDGNTPRINLHINSYGGSIFAALAIIDAIRNLRSDVYTYIDGSAASAATLISVAGAKRFIGKNSMMMIHELSTGGYGKFSELEDQAENNKRLMKSIKSIYKEYTKIPMSKIDEILKHDIWFDANTCLEYGLVDVVR